MPRISLSAALAAQALAERRRAPAQVPLQLELPAYDMRYEEPDRHAEKEDEPAALVLEADGSFTEIR